jgi:hypothetical protein
VQPTAVRILRWICIVGRTEVVESVINESERSFLNGLSSKKVTHDSLPLIDIVALQEELADAGCSMRGPYLLDNPIH